MTFVKRQLWLLLFVVVENTHILHLAKLELNLYINNLISSLCILFSRISNLLTFLITFQFKIDGTYVKNVHFRVCINSRKTTSSDLKYISSKNIIICINIENDYWCFSVLLYSYLKYFKPPIRNHNSVKIKKINFRYFKL